MNYRPNEFHAGVIHFINKKRMDKTKFNTKLAEVFYCVKNGLSFIKSKRCQRISVMKTNTGIFVVFKTKNKSKYQLSGNIACVCFHY